MNEGHSALLALGLLEERLDGAPIAAVTEADIDAVRRQCVFTTHTPVPAGHDQFPSSLARDLLGRQAMAAIEASRCGSGELLNMTCLALRFSHYINGVAMHHGQISQGMFPGYPVRAITNGVHAVTWTAPSFRELYDRHIPEWLRGDHRLVDRRGRGVDRRRRQRSRIAVSETRSSDTSHVLRPSHGLGGGHALGHCRQRVVLQHAAHALAVRREPRAEENYTRSRLSSASRGQAPPG
jgi:starch phosphorylase